MRLIDADKLIGVIKKDSGSALEEAILGIVEGQPTAYDVDKVVEQMEEKSDEYEDTGSSDPGFKRYCNGVSAGYRFAIDIVKAGGVNV